MSQLPFKPDRWGAVWSKAGVELRFGDGLTGIAMGLDPHSTAQLAIDLAQYIENHETQHGILWSEQQHVPTEKLTCQLLGPDVDPDGDDPAPRLLRLVKNLPLSGFEQSVKLQEGQLLSHRFLVGLSLKYVQPEDVLYLASQMKMPTPYLALLNQQLALANFVHFGFEKAADVNLYKLYLEFPDTPPHTLPLYQGFKWAPQHPEIRSVSNYTQPSALTLADVLKRVTLVYAGHQVLALVQKLIQLAASRAPLQELLFVDVKDEDSPRLSFDINVYAAGLKMKEIAPLLATLAQYFSISNASFATLMDSTADDLIGHVSGGTDRHGHPFLTVYHASATLTRQHVHPV